MAAPAAAPSTVHATPAITRSNREPSADEPPRLPHPSEAPDAPAHDTGPGTRMSQYYDLGDRTLWNPSNGASRLFLREVAVFEAELGLPSGLGPMENDACDVDPAALGVFADALVDRHRRTRHAVIQALSEGFVATVMVLAERAGVGVRWESAESAESDPVAPARDVQAGPAVGRLPQVSVDRALRRKAQELSRFMTV